jgi:hypothetical protein
MRITEPLQKLRINLFRDIPFYGVYEKFDTDAFLVYYGQYNRRVGPIKSDESIEDNAYYWTVPTSNLRNVNIPTPIRSYCGDYYMAINTCS